MLQVETSFRWSVMVWDSDRDSLAWIWGREFHF